MKSFMNLIRKLTGSSALKPALFLCLLIAACVLLASSCEKPEELILQNKPQRSGDDTTTTVTPDPPPNPNDSILPPHIEKWIWIRYQTNYCVPHRQEFPPPENWFGPDARAITLNWLDSTYTSQSCLSADGVTLSEISGRFSVKDTCLIPNYATPIIRFNNGITMAKSQYLENNFWSFAFWAAEDYSLNNIYIGKYQVPDQFVYIGTERYHGHRTLNLDFFRINPRNNSKQLTNK